MIKSPKIYIRDSGILHTSLKIKTMEDLLQSPQAGASYEGYIIENITSYLNEYSAYCLLTSAGGEIDLYLEKGSRKIAIEIKKSASPKLNRGFHSLCEELSITEKFLIAPVEMPYKINGGVTVLNLNEFFKLELSF